MLLSYIFFSLSGPSDEQRKTKGTGICINAVSESYDNSIVMNPYVCTYMYIYIVTQHEKCRRYNMHLFMILKVHSVIHVHYFECTFSNGVYSQTFKSCSMNRSTCGNTQLKLKLVHFDNIM